MMRTQACWKCDCYFNDQDMHWLDVYWTCTGLSSDLHRLRREGGAAAAAAAAAAADNAVSEIFNNVFTSLLQLDATHASRPNPCCGRVEGRGIDGQSCLRRPGTDSNPGPTSHTTLLNSSIALIIFGCRKVLPKTIHTSTSSNPKPCECTCLSPRKSCMTISPSGEAKNCRTDAAAGAGDSLL